MPSKIFLELEKIIGLKSKTLRRKNNYNHHFILKNRKRKIYEEHLRQKIKKEYVILERIRGYI